MGKKKQPKKPKKGTKANPKSLAMPPAGNRREGKQRG